MSKLSFSRPARNFFQALPIGNGKTAAMVYGGRKKELLEFNDAELWSGAPHNYDNERSLAALKDIRRLVFDKKYDEAQKLLETECCGNYTEAFMPLGRAKIDLGKITGAYKRYLSTDDGVVKINVGTTERTAFVSYPHGIAVYSIASERSIALKITLSSLLKSSCVFYDGILSVFGNAPDYAAPHYLIAEKDPIRYDKGTGTAFCLSVKVVTDGKTRFDGKALRVSEGKYARLYFLTKTGFLGYDKMPVNNAEEIKNQAVSELKSFDVSFEEILKAHSDDYGELYNRQTIYLQSGNGDIGNLLKRAKKGDLCAELVNILYDYGKYLTICSSRGSQPANLQGQWNDSLRPPWSSNLTTNINTEMNYWGASQVGLNECIQPFYEAVKEICERGKQTAKTNFGARGFACNHNVDIWRNTSPVKGSAMYMYSPLCGAWLANEMFRHKKNIGAIDKDAVTVISEAAKFILDYLTEYDGYLTVCPSVSPEAAFSFKGTQCAVGHSSAFELAIVRQCFANCLETDCDEELKAEINKAIPRLCPFTEAENGIAEWGDGKFSAERGHRHFSPLYGVYPERVIKKGAAEFEWCRRLFYDRIAHARSSIGWSAVWAICLAARFEDAETAENILKKFCARSVMKNLFDFHPPRYFQTDGNFGFIAAINELFITEEDGKARFLPACPELLKSGKMRGFVFYGKKLDFDWRDGKITYIKSDKPLYIKDINIEENAELINTFKGDTL